MKHRENIEMAIKMAEENTANFSGMKYEQGVIDALEWVLEILDDGDFEFGT